MDLSSLERAVSAREIKLDSIEGLITLSTVLVVIGLVIEYWFPLGELIELIKKRPPIPWKKLMEMTGGVLVTVGVAGELWFQSRASSLQTFIRSDTHQIEGLLNKEAGDARKDAGDAMERSRTLENSTQQLKTDADTARKEAENERSARIKVEDSVAWRRLTKEQQKKMGSTLAVFPRQLTALSYNTGDIEAYSFASDIDTALHEFAKWNIAEPLAILKMREGPVNFGTNPPLERGVVVRSTSDAPSRAAAQAVIKELSTRGFDASSGEPSRNARPAVEISVEPRPEGPQGAAKLRAQKVKSKP